MHITADVALIASLILLIWVFSEFILLQYNLRRHKIQIIYHLYPKETQVLVLLGAQQTSALRNHGEFQGDQLVKALNCRELVSSLMTSYVDSEVVVTHSSGSGVASKCTL